MNTKRKSKRRVKKSPKKPAVQGWRTSDQDEIARRQERGASEPCRISIAAGGPFYGDFIVGSESGGSYDVEIRSLTEPLNSCNCPDHAVNRLGTCKHIEAVLHKVAKGKKRRFQLAAQAGSTQIEIFLDRRDENVHIQWPQSGRARSKIRDLLEPFFSADGTLISKATSALPKLQRKIADAPKALRDKVRISAQITPWLERIQQTEQQGKTRRTFEQDVADGKHTLDVVNVPLYPYQQQGMCHLAFTERALLADEMGLGKTVQAIAACELLRRLRGIKRVLVISPASLKAEWEEQIAKFTQLDSLIIQGSRAARLNHYRQTAFFYLCNYEQILSDADDIQSLLAPDVIILDEAQRIKNWQTKTAASVKRLNSRYAFVLTGTPLENRIDEVYSIVQFLDPHLFGPLFRFNRDFYELDEKGQPCGYKNIDELHRRLRPVMLRRRKEEVEGELPGRTVNNYFVTMTDEQSTRYEEYNGHVARLMAQAQRRPLRKEEWERLQKFLACMRMLCDTPYILDSECRDSPKLEELEKILIELSEENDYKIIIFSEWTRMLDLVRELADKLNLGYALHTGTVPQNKRRIEIRRFKEEPTCRLFLSSDAGATGLNLQNANVVINLDLPWNPAKLEQRIARAWRKHQKRSVQVINLVCEHSIEHRMLHLLDQKQKLAQGVLDGDSDLKTMKMPSGRAAFMERMQALMGQTTTTPSTPKPTEHIDPLQRMQQASMTQCGERLELLEIHKQPSGQSIIAVVNRIDDDLSDTLKQNAKQILPEHPLEVLDRSTYDIIQRLVERGVLTFNGEANTLHRSPAMHKPQQELQKQRLSKARQQMTKAERSHKMAQVLAAGGFACEALPALSEATETALFSLALLEGHTVTPLTMGFIESTLVKQGKVPESSVAFVARLREDHSAYSEQQASTLLEEGAALMIHVTQTLNEAALR